MILHSPIRKDDNPHLIGFYVEFSAFCSDSKALRRTSSRHDLTGSYRFQIEKFNSPKEDIM